MKKLLIPAVIFSVLFFSCEQSDPLPQITPTNVTSTVSSGTWRITYYYDSDHEETSSFSGYSFVFNSNGTVVATKNPIVVNGTWSALTDDSQVKLVLLFTSPGDFAELSDDWHVLTRTDTKIELRDISGGNGATDYLTFEKN